MIKAIIFDCFGVLVTEAWVPFRDKMFERGSKGFRQATDAMNALCFGRITESEFRMRLSELTEAPINEIDSALDASVLDERVLGVIRHYKPRYKIGMLSNISPNRLTDFFSPGQVALFDDLALSFDIGAIKPDQAAYHIAAERIGVMPQECVFVDDREHNVAAARDAGMTAIVYTDFAKFERDLEKLLQ